MDLAGLRGVACAVRITTALVIPGHNLFVYT